MPPVELTCPTRPCPDVITGGFSVPQIDVDPAAIRVILIGEAPPSDPADGWFAPGDPFHLHTTRRVFADAGRPVETVQDIIDLGVYPTTAIKCPKQGPAIRAQTIEQCSSLLEREIDAFPRARAIVLAGDIAIKAMNTIAQRRSGQRVIPAGAIYKIRDGQYRWKGIRLFPSYVTTGRSYLMEPSKRLMVAEDIAAALAVT